MHPWKLVKTMKRIRELTVFTLILLFVAGVFAEYAVTASAPGFRAEIAMQGEPSGKASRGSFVDQVIRSTSLFSGADSKVGDPAIASQEHAKIDDSPAVMTEAEEPQPASTPEPVSVTATDTTPAKSAKVDGNYC